MGDPDRLIVEAEALDAFAAASRDRAERFRSLALAFHEGEVTRGAFGIMPASFSMSAMYLEQFESCLAGLRDAAEVMDDIAEGLQEMSVSYTGTDVATKDMFAPAPAGETSWAPAAPGAVPATRQGTA